MPEPGSDCRNRCSFHRYEIEINEPDVEYHVDKVSGELCRVDGLDDDCFWRLVVFHRLLESIAAEAVEQIRTDPITAGQCVTPYIVTAAIKAAASNHLPAIFDALIAESRGHVERGLKG